MRLQLSGRKLYDALLIHLKEVSLVRSEKTLFSRVNLELSGNQKIALLGANGVGKSSLLQLLMGNIEATSGDVWTRPGLRIGYMSQNQEGLPEEQSVLDYFMQQQEAQFSESAEKRTTAWARNFLNQFQFRADSVFRLIHQLSRGERTKLVLSTFMSRQLDLLILDEPTNHLDVDSMECLESALKAFTGALLVVSHDRYLLEQLDLTSVWHIGKGGIEVEWKKLSQAIGAN